MKCSAVVFTFVAAVAAQSASELADAIPACARPSFEKAANSAGCGVTDYVCQCGSKKEQLITVAFEEVVKACRTESEAVLDATEALCEFVNTTSASILSKVADSNAAGMNAVNMGALLSAVGVVAAMM